MLDAVAQELIKDHRFARYFDTDWRRRAGGVGLWLRPLRHEVTGSYGAEDVQRTLFGLLGAIGFVLLVVCANVANLTLARTEKRQQELAVRAALGAGRFRLTRQLLTENILLSCLGGVGGLIVAQAGTRLLVSLIPATMPRFREVQIDGHALDFTLLLSVGTGLLFGLAPGLRASRSAIGNVLKQAGTGMTVGIGWRRYRSVLVIAVVLLTGAGLMIQSVIRLLRVDPGFDTENLLSVDVHLPWQKYALPENQLRNPLFAQLHERLAALPGVTAVGILKDAAWEERWRIDGRAEPVQLFRAACGVDESDCFRAMRLPLLAGRYFDKSDTGKEAGTVLINQSLARLCWPGENAVGRKFRGDARNDNAYEVTGVVADARLYHYDQQVRPIFYRPYHEFDLAGSAPRFVVRSQRDPRTLIPAIRRELKAAEPEMRTPTILVCRQALYDSTQAQRTYMLYLIAFAFVGLLLCAFGIYGVMAYSVARRTREIGIRMAVGAERRHVLAMVVAEGARLVAAGVIAGLLAAFWLTRLLRNQLFQVSPTEPIVLMAVVLFLFAAALLACYIPARRATNIDPMTALRYE